MFTMDLVVFTLESHFFFQVLHFCFDF
jgi:hypothetical protein